jgi:hypothetical protein
VLTLRSAQLKGSVVSIHPVSAADRERSARYCDEFFDAVSVVDDIPRALMERLVPADMVACEIVAQQVFDQTPGPCAGSVMGSSEP